MRQRPMTTPANAAEHYAEEAAAWRALVYYLVGQLHSLHSHDCNWKGCRHGACADIRARALKIGVGGEEKVKTHGD